ncbi:uncharacterized protein LOC108096651 [Drosophila ficusphila]|uniref:uncharacterized protein LOC108096651 n=1 Tax=Drosophila ficusphila TaxID=30025 RepID=UPI0007E77C1C|nr:uncharacterized protein LOC108096651 [Drosophila ficusphila]
MKYAAVVFLFISFSIIVMCYRKPGVNYCTLPVAIIKDRAMCDPLRTLWVLRDGKCKEALQCMDGYSKKECQQHCLKKVTKPKPKPKPKPTPTPMTTCGTTVAEIKTTTEQPNTTTIDDLYSTRETRRPRRTRRTRVYTIKEIC